MDLLGGSITIESKEELGTTVLVRLPLHIRSYVEEPAQGTEPEEQLMDHSDFPIELKEAEAEYPLILVIEDHDELRNFVSSSLRPHFRVLEADNGEMGIRLAIEHIPDAVVTDLMMPLTDGYEVCSSIKKHENTSHVPIVVLTAKTDQHSKIQGWELGADGYLTKPFYAKELLALLTNLIALRTQLAEYFSTNKPSADRHPALPSMEQSFMSKVHTAIEEHLADEQFGVEKLGDLLGLSRTQLHRKLKAIVGQSPGDLIREIRLQRALSMLKANAGTVSEIAYQVGFSIPSSFSSSFSKHFGYAPSDVRKNA